MEKTKRSDDIVTAQTWFDPKSRRLVYDLTTLRVGILMASTEAITFVLPPGEVLFASSAEDARLRWTAWNLSLTVTVGSASYRLYFNPPKSSMSIGPAPSLSGEEESDFGELFTTSTRIAELAGAHGDTFDAVVSLSHAVEVAKLLGDAFGMYQGISNYRNARKVLPR